MDKFPEAFDRFEKEIDISDSKDSDDIIHKFRIWQNRNVTRKQQMLIREISEEKGLIIIPVRKRKGISEAKGKPRKELKRRYGAVTYKTKKGIVRHIQARDSKTGRYVKQ